MNVEIGWKDPREFNKSFFCMIRDLKYTHSPNSRPQLSARIQAKCKIIYAIERTNMSIQSKIHQNNTAEKKAEIKQDNLAIEISPWAQDTTVSGINNFPLAFSIFQFSFLGFGFPAFAISVIPHNPTLRRRRTTYNFGKNTHHRNGQTPNF